MGLRATRIPLRDGVAIVSGFAGVHPTDRVEAFARAPYPLAGDVVLGEVALSQHPERVTLVEQRYDFSCGELTTRLMFDAGDARAELEIVTFCSRTQPTVAAQEVSIRVDRACDVTLCAAVDPVELPGRWDRREREPAKGVDGSMRWESHGALSTCGAAYSTEVLGVSDTGAKPRAVSSSASQRHTVSCSGGALVPAAAADEPRPGRTPPRAGSAGDPACPPRGRARLRRLRTANRRAWESLWQARVRLVGASRRWQALADAAFFYLHSSVHPSSPSSTSMFGLSYWPDYHYYRGHVMWDIEAFALPPLLLTHPDAARSLLDFRASRLAAASATPGSAGTKARSSRGKAACGSARRQRRTRELRAAENITSPSTSRMLSHSLCIRQVISSMRVTMPGQCYARSRTGSKAASWRRSVVMRFTA